MWCSTVWMDLLQLGDHLGIVLQVLQLSAEGLLDVILEGEHVSDVAVDRFVLVPGHVNLLCE